MGSTSSRDLLASGPGWSVSDVLCTAGPHDPPFEERHGTSCIAVVTAGTFQYRSSSGLALLNPGAMLLGNHGSCFECSHEHATGDRCLSFHFDPDYLESIVAAVPGVRRAAFAVPRLPPLEPLTALVAEAEAARDDRDGAALAELALRLAGAVAGAVAGERRRSGGPTARDVRRITAALRRIEADADAPLALADLAQDAAMSPYHFLRRFAQVVGMTPHQFVLRTRLHRAALRLRGSAESIAAVAFASGFNDLSTFNHRFRRVMGLSPRAYRECAAAVSADVAARAQ
jgi:AraC-like DNA-binding protein